MDIPTKTHINPVRRFYRNYLSRFRALDPIKRLVVRFYILYKRNFSGITATLVSISSFAHEHGLKKTVLIPSSIQSGRDFIFFKPDNFTPAKIIGDYESPECAAYEFSNTSIVSRTDFLSYGNLLIHDDNYSPLLHVSTLDQFGIGKAGGSYKTRKFPLSTPSRTIERGINLTSGGAGNYAHFMTEVIPRLIAIDKSGLYDDYPLIVDGWIGRSLTETLIFFNSKCRQIIAVNEFENVRVNNLIHISAPVFAPQDFIINTNRNLPSIIDKENEGARSYLFSSSSISLVRELALTHIKKKTQPQNPHRRIYLKKDPIKIEGVQYNIGREIINDRMVVSILKEYNVEVIDVTRLSILEQVELFQSASVVVAPLGASLTNCIFCNPSTTIIGLGAYYDGADYSYHSAMMASLGLNYSVVLGAQYREQDKNPLHYSYFTCTDSLRESLDSLIQK